MPFRTGCSSAACGRRVWRGGGRRVWCTGFRWTAARTTTLHHRRRVARVTLRYAGSGRVGGAVVGAGGRHGSFLVTNRPLTRGRVKRPSPLYFCTYDDDTLRLI